MHSKMTGHTVSTTCTICSNEVEMFIKEKKRKLGYKKLHKDGIKISSSSQKNVITDVLTDYTKRCKWMS